MLHEKFIQGRFVPIQNKYDCIIFILVVLTTQL